MGRGAFVTIVDLPTSSGQEVADKLGPRARFAAADVRSTGELNEALDVAERSGPLRAVVHCAGRGARVRVIEKDGEPGSLEAYEEIIKLNLIGSFNVLRLAAVRMARAEPIESERGVCVLTASVAAWEGQIGQIPYASSKAGIVGMTLVAARDLASGLIRVCTIAPGVMDTPMLAIASAPTSRRRWRLRCPTPGAWAAGRIRRPGAGISSATRISTARRSGWTARCGWRHDDEPRPPRTSCSSTAPTA